MNGTDTRRRWSDGVSIVLLLIILLLAAGRLHATKWVEGLGMIYAVTLLGALAGLALGQSRFPSRLVTSFAILYGLFVIPWQLTLTAGTMPPDVPWRDRLLTLGLRLLTGLNQLLVEGQSVEDPLLFLSGAALLGWVISVRATYTLVRHGRPWRAILPTGIAVVIIHASDPHQAIRVLYLVAYLLGGLLLVRRITFLRDRSRWRESHLFLHVAGSDVAIIPIAVAILLIAAAWTIPAAADVLPAVRENWREVVEPLEERLDDAFAALRRRGEVVKSAEYYGRSFSLGYGRELTDDLALTVNTPSGVPPGVHYYWQARVYDRYAEGSWNARAITLTRPFDPAASDLDFPDLTHRRTITATFTPVDSLLTLYTAAQPRWISRVGEIELAENPDGTIDVAAMNAIPTVNPGETYQARSSVSDVTISQLRQAGTDYPEWITNRYLQLPPSITPRTEALAQEIAAGLTTPYDVASSVTGYLRAAIDYTEMITQPIPTDQEPIDWFLFDLRRGFCNYYATAEVVLLRSLGIPARVAVGFGQGDLQPQTNTYLVRRQNAHAWPEVYFPEIGWVIFEPTASEPPLYFPPGEEEPGGDPAIPQESVEERWRERLEGLSPGEEAPDAEAAAESTPTSVRLLRWLLVPALVVAGLALAWQLGGRRLPPVPVLLERTIRRLGWTPPPILRRWAERARWTPLEEAYAEINRALARLGAPPTPAHTPAERAAALTQLLPEATDPVRRLASEYQLGAYSVHAVDGDAARKSARRIRRLSQAARLRRLVVEA